MSTTVKQVQIISDEVMLLMALARAFRNSSVDVITAVNKVQALKQLEVFQFQMMLLDLDIKDQSGFELLQTVSRSLAGVPVILMTTGDSKAPELLDKINACRPYGCWHLVEKPFELKKLTGYIGRGLLEHSFEADNARFCSHPKQSDLRRCHRFSRSEQISFSLTAGAQPPFFPAMLTDISVGGMGLTTETLLPTHRRIFFKQKFTQQSGIVIWSCDSGNNYRAGIRFT